MSLGFKVDESQKTLINSVLERVSKERSLNKSDSLVYVIEKYSNLDIGNKSGDYIPTNIRDVLTQIRCGYIGFVKDEFICRENMSKKKKPDILEGEPNVVLNNCLACIQHKLKNETDKRNTEMRKESIKKLQTFMKNFIAISKSGFKYTAFMCLCDADEGKIIFSRGGESLQCPLIEYELVDIQLSCMEKINPNTQNKPCESLASLEGIQAIDPSIFKNIDDIFSDDALIPHRENELEGIEIQNEKLGIDADYKVLDETNYEGECPPENKEKESCIMPLCEYATKCDSYTAHKKWKVIPLK